jgi:hypothetical protein
MTELHWGVRVQEAFIAAVLIGPTTGTTTTRRGVYGTVMGSFERRFKHI